MMNANKSQIPLTLDKYCEKTSECFTKEVEEDIDNLKSDVIPSPFVKWAGGKRFIIKELISNMPDEFNNYYEPFVGGGALFFASRERHNTSYLSDSNFDLVLAYNAIKKNPIELIEMLKSHAKEHSDDFYYKIRSKHELQDPIEVAARFIYLNKTCYNGLYRVNKSGKFNVPIGKYTNPNIIQETNISTCHNVLKTVEIECKDFDQIDAKKDDFVYFDPPYHPTDDTSFTNYTKINFTESDQVRLRDFAIKLHKRGTKVMLSNSNTTFIRNLYNDKIFKIGIVKAPRFVNCKPNKRNVVEELLITSY